MDATARVARSLRAVSGVSSRKRANHPAVTASTRIIINRDTNEQTIVLKRDTLTRARSGDGRESLAPLIVDMKGFKMANLKWCVCYKQVTTTLQLLLLSASSDKDANY